MHPDISYSKPTARTRSIPVDHRFIYLNGLDVLWLARGDLGHRPSNELCDRDQDHRGLDDEGEMRKQITAMSIFAEENVIDFLLDRNHVV